MAILDPVLKRYRTDLASVYGNRLERVVLFGSRARGDARADSDYDIAVFIRDYTDFGKEGDTLSNIELDILEETGAVINSLPYAAGSYEKKTILMQDIRQEGIEL